jgi:hypothetical protein
MSAGIPNASKVGKLLGKTGNEFKAFNISAAVFAAALALPLAIPPFWAISLCSRFVRLLSGFNFSGFPRGISTPNKKPRRNGRGSIFQTFPMIPLYHKKTAFY